MYAFAKWIGYLIAKLRDSYHAGYDHYTTEKINGTALQQVKDLLKQDVEQNYIPAIKLHRQLFGSRLKEAKDAVDQMREQLGFVRRAI